MKTKTTAKTKRKLRIGLVVPHIFMHRDILPSVVFSPGQLALNLASGLQQLGSDVTLFTPGPVDTPVTNVTADLSLFDAELGGRADSYVDLLKKHPFTFISLARQVQSELTAKAYTMANENQLDVVHIYTNEEDIALPFTALCNKPVVFTHHDPFNFLVKYKSVFPKYKALNWISMSYNQRQSMPDGTNWVGNIYHGLPENDLVPVSSPTGDYLAYIGRIIKPKGLHLAIDAVTSYNRGAAKPITLKIAGKHYAGHKKDTYWQEEIVPRLQEPNIEYVGFVGPDTKRSFIGNAKALIVPTLFAEPFGIVVIEALACGTPVIALDSGAIPEIVQNTRTGIVVDKALTADGQVDETATTERLTRAFQDIASIDRRNCRKDFEARFTNQRMCQEHLTVYESLIR